MAQKKTYDGDISQLKFDEHNFNKHTQRGMSMLESSVSDNGFGRSVLVDKDDNIIAGNGIVETAGKLGKKKIRVIETTGEELVVVKRTDLSIDSEQGREMALADNASAAVDLDWNEEAMREMGERFNLDFGKYGLDPEAFASFDPDDLDTSDSPTDAEEDDYDEDVNVAPKKVRRGDVWVMGNHRLICGDSTDPNTIRMVMQDEKADLLLTDPPYNVAYTGGLGGNTKKRDAIANDNMESDEFRSFLTKAFGGAIECMKEGAGFYIWYAITEHTNFTEAAKAAGFKISEYLLWVKNAFVLGRMDYHYRHEPCVYGWKPGAAHHWYSDRAQTTVLEFDKPHKSTDHPTMKPVPLFVYQMGNSTKDGDIVLDIFSGSGTTMVAAEQLHRKARLVEYEEHYADVILDRYINLVGSDADVYLLKDDGTRVSYADVEYDRL